MKKLLLIFFLGLLILPIINITVSIAQDANIEELGDIEEFAYGQVLSISSSNVVVKEFDYDKEIEIEVSYKINSDTEFENVGSYNEIVVGDDVEIDYIQKEGINIAINIAKAKADVLEDYFVE